MWRLIKKWWLLKQLDKAIALHTEKSTLADLSAGGKVLLTQSFFIHGNDKYKGIARKSAERFSWILRWRKHDEYRLKKKIRQCNALFESCVKDGYIEIQIVQGQPMLALTNTADDIHGLFGLIQLLSSKFTIAWGVIASIATFIIGLKWQEILNFFLRH